MIQRILSLVAVVVLLQFPPAAVAGPPAWELTATTVGDAVNINTADVTALMQLNGVGRKVAEKIVEYRQAHGPFKKPEDLRKVEGFGAGLWERNRDRIVVK